MLFGLYLPGSVAERIMAEDLSGSGGGMTDLACAAQTVKFKFKQLPPGVCIVKHALIAITHLHKLIKYLLISLL